MSLVLGATYRGTSRTPTTAGASGLLKTAAGAAVSITQAALGVRFDAAPAYIFAIELEGILAALFTECSGIGLEREVLPVAEGGVNNYVHQLPGRVSYPHIILKRGLSLSTALWEWFAIGMYDMHVQRINFSIVQGAPGHNLATALLGAVGAASVGESTAQSFVHKAAGGGIGKVKHWNVEDAWPVSWKQSALNTSSTSVAIEEIEIAHHGIALSSEVGTPMSPASSVIGAVTSLF